MKKKVLAIILAAAMLGGLMGVVATAEGEPTVLFDAKDNTFTIKGVDIVTVEGVQNVYPDLFPTMKGMMPGDKVTQAINIEVDNVGSNTVKLYLKAESTDGQPTVKNEEPVKQDNVLVYENNADPVNSDYSALFAEGLATLTVSYPGKDTEGNDVVLTTDGTLKDGAVELGTFTSDAAKSITVTFELPITADNRAADKIAHLGWVFTAEVIEPAPTPPPSGPIIPDNPPALNKVDHFAYIVGYPDGNVKPQGNITRAEVATIFFRMLTDESRNEFWSQNSGYSDVTINKWFNNAISTLANGGILTGYADGTFKPNANITRAEFATMAVRFFSSSYEGEDLFPDIDKHWAKDYINTAANEGIINGYEDGTFRPDQPITRAEAMTIVNRVLERHPDKDHLLADMIQWPDNMDTEKWYYADVQEATNSHDYDMKGTEAEPYEVWSKMLPVRDWVAFEKEWSDANSAQGGEVVK